MLDQFKSYYQENQLFQSSDKIILAVSGGKDSMAMLHLFYAHKLNFGVAHCNFQLRGEEADKDENLVKDFAEKNQMPFYSIKFNTKEYATVKGISIQMAARELRYDWFEKIRKENSYDYIATAHHKNDVAETMLINLIKGTGLSGLHGIRNKSNFIIRPLLCFDRKEIDNYIKEKNIPFRDDQSNSDTKYFRNAVRHNIIPELEKLNSSIIRTLNAEASRFLDLETILEDKIKVEKENCFEDDNEGVKINIKRLQKLNPLKIYLYYFIKDFGFNFSDVEDIIDGLENQSGKKYYSSTHALIKDRDYLIVKKNDEPSFEQLTINTIKDLPFDYQLIDITADEFEMNPSTDIAYFDADKVQFPLTLRTWKNGDVFQPLGMKGNKKVSDFLIDNKMSLFDKERVEVLLSDNQIIWVVGYRINDNFKIKKSSKLALVLSLKD